MHTFNLKERDEERRCDESTLNLLIQAIKGKRKTKYDVLMSTKDIDIDSPLDECKGVRSLGEGRHTATSTEEDAASNEIMRDRPRGKTNHSTPPSPPLPHFR